MKNQLVKNLVNAVLEVLKNEGINVISDNDIITINNNADFLVSSKQVIDNNFSLDSIYECLNDTEVADLI